MRQAFINTLIQLAEQDKDIYLLTADMGFGLVEPFATKFPRQYINIGVAEQNMIGVATGLALEGKKVFCYSIANFPTMRCLEQIRNDVCYHNLPVCIVSGGAGLWYGALGMTHWALEDIAVMRCLPNMSVVSPCDVIETGYLVRDFAKTGTPFYIRISKSATEELPSRIYKFNQGKLMTSQPNPDITILATGGRLVENSLSAVKLLRGKKISVRVVSLHTVKPIEADFIEVLASDSKVIITIEEHSKIGGLGSTVAEVLAGLRQHPPLVRMGTEDRYLDTAMSYEELLVANHLTVDDIVKAVLDNGGLCSNADYPRNLRQIGQEGDRLPSSCRFYSACCEAERAEAGQHVLGEKEEQQIN